MTRRDRILTAMQAIASWPNCTPEAVAEAAIEADNLWLWEVITEHANADGWTLATRNALLKRIENADCLPLERRLMAISEK
tara:strand:+ start:7959 stop:8201 length:243 start_codon:yes stop_codon:yes gene_type:complete